MLTTSKCFKGKLHMNFLFTYFLLFQEHLKLYLPQLSILTSLCPKV